MEKTIVKLSIVGIIVLYAFTLGFENGSKRARTNTELTKSLEVALDKAEVVIDNNNLYDTDGSDAMSEYLDAQKKVYTLYNK